MMKGVRMQLNYPVLFIFKLGCVGICFLVIFACQRALITPAELQITYNDDLRINEILFNPLPGGVDFVELFNPTTETLDLSVYAIATRTKSGTLNPIVPLFNSAHRNLNGGEYIVVTTNPTIIQAHYPQSECKNFIHVSKLPNFPNQSGLVILLKDTNQTRESIQYKIIDSIEYGTSMHHPLLKKHQGISLERVVTNSLDKPESTFASSSILHGGATPGFVNSQQPTAPFGMWIEHISSTKERDGIHLHYSFEKTNLMATVEIYDMEGRLQSSIVNNELIGTRGIWQWDGQLNENKTASPGIYMLYIELYDTYGYRKKYRQSFSFTPIN